MSNKVLVFESDAAFAGELRAELDNLGCTVSVVDDGNVGLQQAASDKPDLILLSIELPRMNGFSVCNKLKKDANLKDIPLIIMSSESSEETFDQHKKLRTRAEDYVHKPIAFGELLEHIQQFVPLGAPASTADGGAIVIDDEIEVGSSDYLVDEEGAITEDADLSDAEVEPAASVAVPAEPDVDTFTESAFGRMTDANVPLEAHGAKNGSAAAAAPARDAEPAHAAPLAAPDPFPAFPAAAAVAPAAAAVPLAAPPIVVRDPALEGELASARERLREVEQEREEARREATELRTKLQTAQAAPAVAPKTGGVTSREFLDLREALNKKDKDILAFKEQVSKKDREIVESKERALGLERSMADVEDRLLGLERELASANERAEAVSAEGEASKQALEELRVRADRLKGEGEAKDRQLAELRAQYADERTGGEMKLAALRAETDSRIANERAEHARALDQAEHRRGAELEQAQRDRDAALTEARDQAAREAEALRVQQANEISALEQARDARIAGIEAERAREREEAKQRVAELEDGLSSARQETRVLADAKRVDDEAHDARIAAVQKRLLDVQSARDDLEQKMAQANAKRESDRRSLERAKDAMAVALAQIEETEL